jgi:hypothetical protein
MALLQYLRCSIQYDILFVIDYHYLLVLSDLEKNSLL